MKRQSGYKRFHTAMINNPVAAHVVTKWQRDNIYEINVRMMER